jgi:hypothetical protein
LLLKSINDE